MDIEECKESYKVLKRNKQVVANIDKDFFLKFAETVLSELEKKEAIINEIANKLVEAHSWFYSEFDNFSKEDFIKYFTNKVIDINVGE